MKKERKLNLNLHIEDIKETELNFTMLLLKNTEHIQICDGKMVVNSKNKGAK